MDAAELLKGHRIVPVVVIDHVDFDAIHRLATDAARLGV